MASIAKEGEFWGVGKGYPSIFDFSGLSKGAEFLLLGGFMFLYPNYLPRDTIGVSYSNVCFDSGPISTLT